MNDVTDLISARRANARMQIRAIAAWKIISELYALRILAPRKTVIDGIAHKIYYSERYSANEEYECIKDFKEALTEDLDTSLTRNGENYELKTFFSGGGVENRNHSYALEVLGISYLTAYCSINDFDVLKKAEIDADPLEPISGFSPREIDMVVKGIRRNTLSLINTFRHCSTAIHYTKYLFNKEATWKYLSKDMGAIELVARLSEIVALPFTPKPANCFGTDADKNNPLKRLTLEMEQKIS